MISAIGEKKRLIILNPDGTFNYCKKSVKTRL